MTGWKPRTGQKIERLYAWIAEEPDGGEGIMSAKIGDTHFPLVGADKDRMESFRPIAEAVREASGYPIRLVEFSVRTAIETLP